MFLLLSSAEWQLGLQSNTYSFRFSETVLVGQQLNFVFGCHPGQTVCTVYLSAICSWQFCPRGTAANSLIKSKRDMSFTCYTEFSLPDRCVRRHLMRHGLFLWSVLPNVKLSSQPFHLILHRCFCFILNQKLLTNDNHWLNLNLHIILQNLWLC